ncbi:MAG: CocE/NonD family hydrolase [Gemmatimonadetes bacterium]|nr:CocE/NonD family hydrolase [Gemmatimonadota bacterium]
MIRRDFVKGVAGTASFSVVGAIVGVTACGPGGEAPGDEAGEVAVMDEAVGEIVSAGLLEAEGLEGIHREIGYAPMPDGVHLAYVSYRPAEEGQFPVILDYDAYESSGAGIAVGSWFHKAVQRGYAVVGANVRGSGCSQGDTFSLFHPMQGPDGAALVEWLGTRPWSDGNVGMYGVSYPGHTQFFVAAQRPAHLKALAAGGLTASIYREALRPGGMFNVGFAAWWGEMAQPWIEELGVAERIAAGDTQCEAVHAAQPVNTTFQEAREHEFHDQYWNVRSPESYADQVEVPMMIIQGYQDQQTAMGGPRLYERLKGPRKLILQNGGHGVGGNALAVEQVLRWMDRWLKDEQNGIEEEPQVTVLFETGIVDGDLKANWVETFSDWPVPETERRAFNLAVDGSLTPDALGDGQSGSLNYVYPMGTELVGNNDMFRIPPAPLGSLIYRSAPFEDDLPILGSARLVLHVSAQAEDTDLMVVLHDIGPDGETLYLQRAFLRASHRAIDPALSSEHWTHHPHDRSEPLVPGEAYELVISFPEVGHVFRAGHAVELAILAPSFSPATDWGPMAIDLPGINTVYHSADHPSRLELPVVASITAAGPPPECGSLEYQPCRPRVEPDFTAAGMTRDLAGRR